MRNTFKQYVIFYLVFIIVILSVSYNYGFILNVTANAGTMNNWTRTLPQLEQVLFQTSTGGVYVNPLLTTVYGRDFETTAFTLDDPRPLDGNILIRSQALDARINTRLLSAVLVYSELFSLQQIMQQTGLVLTQDQVLAATQLAVWRLALASNPSFQIQEASIADANVRSLATSIISWATTQTNVIASNQNILLALAPPPQPQIDSSQSVMQTDGVTVTFGPYVVHSVLPIEMAVSASHDGIIINQAGTIIGSVVSNQPFFIQVPITQTGIVEVSLASTHIVREFQHYRSRVWLSQRKTPQELRFTVSTTPGSSGTLLVNITDTLTNMPLQNISINILHNNSIIYTGYTNLHGVFAQELPIADYTLQVISPQGYLEVLPYHFSIGFIGDVQIVNIPLSRSEAIVNFFVVNEATNAAITYAEAFIYESGNNNPMRRIGFQDGSAQGLVFQPGSYTLSIYLTLGGYAISGQVPFTIDAGDILDLVIPLTPSVPLTTIRLNNDLNKNNWLFSLYRGDEYLFTVPVSNSQLEIYLPQLESYQVVAKTSDGAFGPFFSNFNVTVTAQEVVIDIRQGTEIVSIQFVDIYLKEPIPNIIAGIFDENHNLVQMRTANLQGAVKFEYLEYGKPYFVNIIAAPPGVSGYSAVGNRFLGRTRNFILELYSFEHIKEYSEGQDAILRMPNITWQGPTYIYPTPPESTPVEYPYSDPETGRIWRYEDDVKVYEDEE